MKPPSTPSPRWLRALRVLLWEEAWIAVGLAHVLLALWLVQGPLILAKYPNFAQLLRQHLLTAEEASAPSPGYLLLNLVLPPLAMKALHLLAAVAAIRAIHRLARAWLGLPAALVAAAAFALARPVFVYEHVLEPDFLLMVCLICGLEACWLGGGRLARGAGVALLGFAVALRPIVAPAAALVVLVAIFWSARNIKGVRPLAAQWAPPALVGVFFALAPLLVVGLAATGRPELLGTMSGGGVLHMSSRPESDGDGGTYPYVLKLLERQDAPRQNLPDYAHALWRALPRVIKGPQLSAQECQDYWRGLWNEYRRAHPAAFARLHLRKMAFALTGSRAIDLAGARAIEYRLSMRHVGLEARLLSLLALAGLGAFLVLARGGRALAGVFAVLLSSLLVFYISSRYLVALVPFQVLFASALVSLALKRDWRAALAAAGGLAMAGALVMWWPVAGNDRYAERLEAAAARWGALEQQRASRDLPGLVRTLPEALADLPDGEWEGDFRLTPFEDPEMARQAARISEQRWGKTRPLDVSFLVRLHEMAGDCEEAEKLAATLPIPLFVPGYYDLPLDPFLAAGRCAAVRRDWTASAAWASKSLENLPGNREALAMKMAAAGAIGDPAAIASASQELDRLHDPFSGRLAAAQALRRVGLGAQGEGLIDQLLSALPDFFFFRYEKAQILASEQKWIPAARELDRAMEAMGRFSFHVRPFEPGLEAMAREAGDDPQVARTRIRILARLGRVAEAEALARQWAEKSGGEPSFADLQRSLSGWTR
ncbi:MAG TPA: hypothetical protein VGK67_31875 [Myxococcales bacterium]